MSKHIRPVFAVPETAVILAAVEKGVAAFGGDRRGSAGVSVEEVEN